MNENSIYRKIMKQLSETGSLPDGCTIAKQEYGNVVFAEGCLEHFGKGLGQMEKLPIEFENLLDDMATGNLMDPSRITEETFRTSETSMRNLDGCLEEWMEAHASRFNDQTLCAYASSVILNTGFMEDRKSTRLNSSH